MTDVAPAALPLEHKRAHMAPAAGEGDAPAPECRVCRVSTEPLYAPCKCKGSIQFVHQECLMEWLKMKGLSRCELCGYEFQFSNVFAPDAPVSVRAFELAIWTLTKIAFFVPRALRVLLVMASWLFLVPLLTCWTMYLFLFHPGQRLLSVNGAGPGLLRYLATEGYGAHQIWLDSQYGIILCIAIVAVSVLLTSLRELLHEELDVVDDDPNAGLAGDEQQELGLEQQGAVQGAVAGGAGAAAQQNDGDDELSDLEEQEGDSDDELAAAAPAMAAAEAKRAPAPAPQVEEAKQQAAAPVIAGNAPGDQLAAAPPQADAQPRDAAAAAAPAAAPAPAQQQPQQPPPHDNFDDLPLATWLGLEGPLHFFAIHLLSITMFNFFFLALSLFVPLNMGRIIFWLTDTSATEFSKHLLALLLQLSCILFLPSTPAAGAASDLVAGSVSHASSFLAAAAEFALQQSPLDGASAVASAANATQASGAAAISAVASAASWAAACAPEPAFVDVVFARVHFETLCLVAVGYVACLGAAVLFALVGGGFGWSRLAGSATELTRDVLIYLATGIKVCILICAELAVFPILVGLAVDLLCLEILAGTLASRHQWFVRAPITATSLHWFVGIIFMLVVSFFASLLRKVVRKKVLENFLRYPDDPDFQPFREMVHVPVFEHLARMLASLLLYIGLVFLCLHVPMKLSTRLVPTLAPLNIRLSDPTEMPVDLLLFHICVPFLLDKMDLKTLSRNLVAAWFRLFSRRLQLAEYLLPQPLPPAAPAAAVAPAAIDGAAAAEAPAAAAVPADGQQDNAPAAAAAAPAGDAAAEPRPVEPALVLVSPAEESKLPPSSSEQETKADGPAAAAEPDLLALARGFVAAAAAAPIFVAELPAAQQLQAQAHAQAQAQAQQAQAQQVAQDAALAHALANGNADAELVVVDLVDGQNGNAPGQGPLNQAQRDADARADALVIPHFRLRVFALLFALWLTHIAFMFCCALLPVLTGRYLLTWLRTPLSQHDVYAFLLGFTVYFGTAFILWRAVAVLRTHRMQQFAQLARRWLALCGKCALVAALLFGALPFLVGLLFDLIVVMPLRSSSYAASLAWPAAQSVASAAVNATASAASTATAATASAAAAAALANATSTAASVAGAAAASMAGATLQHAPHARRWQDWALGLLLLKAWSRLVLAGAFGNGYWKRTLEQVMADGVHGLRVPFVLRAVFRPMALRLAAALLVPFVLARLLFPLRALVLAQPVLLGERQLLALGDLGTAGVWAAVGQAGARTAEFVAQSLLFNATLAVDLAAGARALATQAQALAATAAAVGEGGAAAAAAERTVEELLRLEDQLVFRFAFLAFALALCAGHCARALLGGYRWAQRLMHEERYLVNKRLVNFGGASPPASAVLLAEDSALLLPAGRAGGDGSSRDSAAGSSSASAGSTTTPSLGPLALPLPAAAVAAAAHPERAASGLFAQLQLSAADSASASNFGVGAVGAAGVGAGAGVRAELPLPTIAAGH